LTKRLTLRGIDINGDLPVLDAMGREVAIFINANDTIVDGFKFINSTESGIKIISNNNTIKNNKFMII